MAQQADPPGRVARLNHVQGPVIFSPAGDNEWTDAVLNRPLTRGDRVWTDRGSRAEIQVGSSAVRMDGQTHLEILALDDQSAQLSVTQGTVYMRVRSLPEGENFEIDTPNLAYRAAYPGDYRVDVDASRATTRVTIHSGTGAVYGENGQALPLGGGQQITFRGRALVQLNAQESPPQDTFDRWAAERNRLEDQAISARFVPREVVGYQQLDAHGRWAHDVTHGMVWFPHGTVVNWAPYRHGHWEWISPWGWTWIDDAPWGFAPFHYGRWTMIESRWAWVPGRLGLRPVYAPALVAFIGGSAGANWKIGSGIAWFPLAPGEAFQPGYRASPVYISNLNRNITVQADAGYAYQRSVEALTAISAEDFHRGKPMRGGWLRVAANTLTSAQIVPPPPMPERSELVAHQRAAPSRVAPPAEAEIRKVIATSVPAGPPENVQRVPREKETTQRDAQRQAQLQWQAQAQAKEQAQVQSGAPQETDAQPRQSADPDRAQRRLARRAERAKRNEQARLDEQAARELQAKANPPVKTAEASPPGQQVPAAAEHVKRTEQTKAKARREQLASRAEQAKREQAARQVEQARREQVAIQAERARREQRAKSVEQARREQASLRAEQVKREQTAQRAGQARREQIATRAEQAKREQLAKSASQARREQIATRAEQARREQMARRAEQAKRDQAARRTEVAKREQARREQLALRAEQARREEQARAWRVEQARHEEQLRRDARAQQVEQARRAAERDAQALREQRHQREEHARREEQARREAQERELAQREAWQRQQQAIAEQWRRDQQLWEQQQRDRVRQRPYLRDDRRQPAPQPEIWQRGIPILNPGRTS